MVWLLIIPLAIYASVLLYISGFLRKINSALPAFNENLPALSVVIACRNEERNISGLLRSLAAQDYPPHLFEVVVVDDNSSDATFNHALEFKELNNLKVIRSRGSGKKASVRYGVENASFPLVVTTDADCRMNPAWLRTIALFFNTFQPEMIIGPVKLVATNSLTGLFQMIEWSALQGITAGTAEAGSPVMCSGANMAFTKETYMRHSRDLRNHLASGDDIFFLQSLKKGGKIRIMWLPSSEASVTTPAASSVKSLINQRARWVSKSGEYRDPYTIFLAIVTLLANLSLPFLFLASLLGNSGAVLPLAVAFIVKVSADLYFIIQSFNTLRITKPANFSAIFFLSEILYPLYIIIVTLKSIGRSRRW